MQQILGVNIEDEGVFPAHVNDLYLFNNYFVRYEKYQPDKTYTYDKDKGEVIRKVGLYEIINGNKYISYYVIVVDGNDLNLTFMKKYEKYCQCSICTSSVNSIYRYFNLTIDSGCIRNNEDSKYILAKTRSYMSTIPMINILMDIPLNQ